MTGAQPNPMHEFDAETKRRTDVEAEQAAEARPEFAGDMPDDPEQAIHYRRGADQPDGGDR